MKCIFCLNERQPGNEHVFPRAIGGSLRTERVCGDALLETHSCNSMLGSDVDGPLVNHPFIAMHRQRLNLSSYSGKIPDPVHYFLGGVGTLANEPSQKVKLHRDPITGQLEPQLLPHTKREVLPDGTINYQIMGSAQGGFSEVRKIIGREVKRIKKEFPLLDFPDEKGLDQIAHDCIRAAVKTGDIAVNYELKIDIKQFQKGIIKIAYELAFLWLGEDYLADPTAAKIRSFVLQKSDKSDMGILGQFFLDPTADALKAGSPDNLIAYNYVSGDKMVICVNLFNQVSGLIVVSDSPRDYCNNHSLSSFNFIEINAQSGLKRQSDLAEAVHLQVCKALQENTPSEDTADTM